MLSSYTNRVINNRWGLPRKINCIVAIHAFSSNSYKNWKYNYSSVLLIYFTFHLTTTKKDYWGKNDC